MRRLVALLMCVIALYACVQSVPMLYAAWPRHRGEQPISHRLMEKMRRLHMTKEAPILIRIFKNESKLEIWKKDAGGIFALLKTYDICRWSGELGPKIREGDHRSPEGFYAANSHSMNPRSIGYLGINVGYPNAFDSSHGRTGSFIMIHGLCVSVGCFAMGNDNIKDIYALAREAFAGGEQSIQIQIYPFRMTERAIARHRRSRHYAFWQNLKEGYDAFERTHMPLRVGVCHGRYTFNAGPCTQAQ
jgi:murein L,D-transpeptidase YafK